MRVCDQWGVQYLDEAQYLVARNEGREYDLTGGHGHTLELLLRLAGCQALLADADFRGAWNRVAEWEPGWRYRVPTFARRDPSTYLAAFRSVAEAL